MKISVITYFNIFLCALISSSRLISYSNQGSFLNNNPIGNRLKIAHFDLSKYKNGPKAVREASDYITNSYPDVDIVIFNLNHWENFQLNGFTPYYPLRESMGPKKIAFVKSNILAAGKFEITPHILTDTFNNTIDDELKVSMVFEMPVPSLFPEISDETLRLKSVILIIFNNSITSINPDHPSLLHYHETYYNDIIILSDGKRVYKFNGSSIEDIDDTDYIFPYSYPPSTLISFKPFNN